MTKSTQFRKNINFALWQNLTKLFRATIYVAANFTKSANVYIKELKLTFGTKLAEEYFGSNLDDD